VIKYRLFGEDKEHTCNSMPLSKLRKELALAQGTFRDASGKIPNFASIRWIEEAYTCGKENNLYQE